jgi:hypothetical protein
MKEGILKAVFSILLIAVAVCGFSVAAHAFSGEASGTSLLYTYYDVRSTAAGGLGLTDNYYTVTNTATDRWVQAHVRVRTGHHSIELLDFDILLSPTDNFTMDLYEDAGATVFASCDTGTLISSGFTPNFDRDGDGTDDCFVLDSTTFPAMLSLILQCDPDATTVEEALEHTKKGYVEILGEGVILADNFFGSGDKGLCRGPDGVVGGLVNDDVIVSGKLLDNTNPGLRLCTSSNGVGRCPFDCTSMFGNELIGRVYYARVSSVGGIVDRFAQLNAEVMDDGQPLILHKENYDNERTDADCAGVDAADGCYAYAAASTSAAAVTNGADDMNFCLYTDSISAVGGVTGVRNKFGAAATFGPTLADLVGYRDGSLAATTAYLNAMSFGMSLGYYTSDGASSGNILKTFADSHYFSVPSPNPYDIRTAFAFIFPLQHFIAESDVITAEAIYDNNENRSTVPLSKFISPGLPTITAPGEEAALFVLSSPFAEGWIRFATSATNQTSAAECTPGASPCPGAGVNVLVNSGSISYLPGYTGAVWNLGSEFISVSHFQYNEVLLP